MPVLYKIQCEECGFQPEKLDPDDESSQCIIPGGHLEFIKEDGEIIYLRPPLEEAILEENGGSWSKSSKSGQLMDVYYMICENCSTLQAERRVHNKIGCWLYIFLSVAVYITLDTLHAQWYISLICSWLTVCAIAIVHRQSYKRKWSKKNESMRLKSCKNCSAQNIYEVEKVGVKKLNCPKCEQKTVRVAVHGKGS